MALIVQKFGGSSVGDLDRIKNVAKRIALTREQGHQVAVVVSAMGDSTDHLVELALAAGGDMRNRETDALLATGEQVSAALLALTLGRLGVPAISLTGPQAGIMTDGMFGRAKITDIDSSRVKTELDNGKVVIVTGFQGMTESGDITTLGRGGSDTSAVALAVALKADSCEIHTDVDGVYTADPRVVNEARKIQVIGYDEMLELASQGAKVLHLRSVELAKRYGLTMHVRSSLSFVEGTLVKEVGSMEGGNVVTGIAHNRSLARITVTDFEGGTKGFAELFRRLSAEQVNVDMIVQGTTREGMDIVSFTVNEDDVSRSLEVCESIGQVSASQDVAKVSIVGAGMISRPGVAAKMFSVLSEALIEILMTTTSDISISCLVPHKDVEEAVRLLHKGFGLEG